mgnify:FL=1
MSTQLRSWLIVLALGLAPCNPGFFIEIQNSAPTSHLQFLVRQLLTHYHPQYHHRKTSFLWWQHD